MGFFSLCSPSLFSNFISFCHFFSFFVLVFFFIPPLCLCLLLLLLLPSPHPVSVVSISPLPFLPVALGRNQPLKRERPKWKSDYPMTEGQLRSKRDEFWDTAPAFDGRKEIWDALRAAASAFESSDHLLAQAILDGASITLPHGNTQHIHSTAHSAQSICFAPTNSTWVDFVQVPAVDDYQTQKNVDSLSPGY